MHKRVTMQQLADACGLSRNTVSKVFNDRGAIPETTRQLVLQTAKDLGYYAVFDQEQEAAPPPPPVRNIALLTRRVPTDTHFGIFFLPAFTKHLSQAGYTLMMYELTAEERAGCRLPTHMSLDQIAGISTIELFDRPYLDMLCGLGPPCLTVDGPVADCLTPMGCDCISMENGSSAAALTRHMLSAGASRVGFVGDPSHCASFRQRWQGFTAALAEAGVPLDRGMCILSPDSPEYSDEAWLAARLRAMPSMPDAFVCANDFLAMHLLSAIKSLGLSVPEDVMVAGFDDTPQAAVVEPSLTTVQIPNADIGRMAADMLLERIQHPDRPFRSTYVQTTPVWRSSTAR